MASTLSVGRNPMLLWFSFLRHLSCALFLFDLRLGFGFDFGFGFDATVWCGVVSCAVEGRIDGSGESLCFSSMGWFFERIMIVT